MTITSEELDRLEALAKGVNNERFDTDWYAPARIGSVIGRDAEFIAAASPATILSLIALARIGLAAEKLSQYAEHDSDCVLSKWSAGRPTDDGGYEMKFAGVWYKARPVDESPPCECGLAEILSSLPKPGGE